MTRKLCYLNSQVKVIELSGTHGTNANGTITLRCLYAATLTFEALTEAYLHISALENPL